MGTVAKFIVALLFAVVTALASALSDNTVTNTEWIMVAIGATTAANVWLTANVPSLTWAKTAVAAVLAGLDFLVAAITDGITTSEWLNLGIVVLGVVAVWWFPNKPQTAARTA